MGVWHIAWGLLNVSNDRRIPPSNRTAKTKISTGRRVFPAVPDLQAFTPGAHVFPQQQVVQRDSGDDVKLLFDHLFDEVWVHPMLTHGGVEKAKTLQEDFHCNSLLLRETGASFPQASWFRAQNALDCFMLQHACNYTGKTHRGKTFHVLVMVRLLKNIVCVFIYS